MVGAPWGRGRIGTMTVAMTVAARWRWRWGRGSGRVADGGAEWDAGMIPSRVVMQEQLAVQHQCIFMWCVCHRHSAVTLYSVTLATILLSVTAVPPVQCSGGRNSVTVTRCNCPIPDSSAQYLVLVKLWVPCLALRSLCNCPQAVTVHAQVGPSDSKGGHAGDG